MRDIKYLLKQSYDCSRALVIGIDQYQNASPLGYAVSDATEMRTVLISELNFQEENVLFLTDTDATKSNILKAFHTFTSTDINIDDRLVVFFAGHGHTRKGLRGDVGYLVPHDADMNDYSSFIRWDELTRNAELIRAKHILFIMDACYGGLAVNRNSKLGTSRFLKDMYQRLSRQVITAGKADEVVADTGGPMPNHSIFTGHLIEGIRGKAANDHGIITASGLMAYVYTKVANDLNSDQTPHYGQFDGDGDFIISAPNIAELSEEQKKDIDELIAVPYAEEARNTTTLDDKVSYLKEILSAPQFQIKLHDFISEELRRFLANTNEDNFAVIGHYSIEALLNRIGSYENKVKDLSAIIGVTSYWCPTANLNILSKIMARTCDRLLQTQGGTSIWLHLRWYPLLLLTYHAGIAAVESKNYKSLVTILYTKLGEDDYGSNAPYFAQKLSRVMLELKRADVFKRIPGHENNYTPASEYIFKHIQPMVDDLFFLGKGYEAVFDEFEILFALAIMDLSDQTNSYTTPPIGRFGWKHDRRDNPPLTNLINEANTLKENWPPIQAGMFGGSYERFAAVAKVLKERTDTLDWY